MKCEICGHKIPIGSKECSNCGYQLEKRVVRVKDDNDENVIVKKLDLKEKAQVKYMKSYTVKFDKLFVVFLLLIGVTLFNVFIPFSSDDIVMEDDEYSSVEIALNYQQQIEQEFEDLGIKSIYSTEDKNDLDDSVEVTCFVYGSYNYNEYVVSFVVRDGTIMNYSLEVYDSIGGDLEAFPIPDIDIFSDMMGYESIVDELDEIREYNPKVGYEYEDERIEAYETYTEDDIYDVYYRIAGNGYILN